MKTRFLLISAVFLFIFTGTEAQNNKNETSECEAWFYPYFTDNDYRTVYFQDGSSPQEDIISRHWDFGDGTTSDEDNPQHTYTADGVYKVVLTIQTSDCSDVYQDSISIAPGNIPGSCADYYYEISGSNFRTVNFFENSPDYIDIDSRHWDFGDGSTSSEQNPVHVFAQDTVYPVKLTVTSGDCSDSVTYYISVGEDYYQGDSCLAMFSFEKMDPAGLTFHFYDVSYIPGDTVQTYLWDFGDGTTSDEANPVHTFAAEGEYVVSLTVENEQCNSHYESMIYAGEDTWYPEACQAMFYVFTNSDNYRELYFNDFSYGDSPVLARYWNFGDGTVSTLQNPVHEFAEDGTYRVTLTVETNNCQSTLPMDIRIFENENTADSLMPMFYPENLTDSVKFHNLTFGDADRWYWDFGDGTSSDLFSPIHSFEGHGIHQVALSAYRGTSVNTVVIEFYVPQKKDTGTDTEINYAYLYAGGINSVDKIETFNFKIYPNPANDFLMISASEDNIDIEIYDFTGRKVAEKNNAKNRIDISGLPEGIYLIKIYGSKLSGTVKFIKH